MGPPVLVRLVKTMNVYSTIWCNERPGLSDQVRVLHRGQLGKIGVLKRLRRLRRGDAVLLNGALGARELWVDMLLAAYIRFFKPGVTVLVSDATWHPRSSPQESRAAWAFRIYSKFQKALLQLGASTTAHFCFLSRNEVEVVSRESKIPRHQLHFTPFCAQLPVEIAPVLQSLAAQNSTDGFSYVFAGGNGLRDYDTLLLAASGSSVPFRIASSNQHGRLPENVQFRPLSHHDFFYEMARSSIVALPLLPIDGRSAGQQTYLNALALGKPLVITDVIGVRDHLEHGRHALIVPPRDPAALREAIEWLMDPAHASDRARMTREGLALTREMTFAHYCAGLETLLRHLASASADLSQPKAASDRMRRKQVLGTMEGSANDP